MSSISSLNSAGLNFSGLASGIDTEKLIDGLLGVQKARVSTLQQRQERAGLLQTTYKTLESQVIELQATAARLGRAANGAFDLRQVAVSDGDLVKAAAGSAAAPGTYTFKVNALAQAHQLASAGLADSGTLLRTGTLALKVGDGATTTVALDDSNNTLAGLAAAINNSGGDVAASVINDGSAAPHRLLLTSKKTGLANDIEVTNNLTAGAGAALDLDPATRTIQQGADAQVVLGSGAGALAVASASNKLDALIGGVTLDLQAADPTKTVTLTVSNDTDAARKAVGDLADSFNKVIDFIDQRDDFDPQTNEAGTLLGSTVANDLQNQLARVLGGAVAGVNTAANRLAAIGLTFNEKGRLQVDGGKLDKALTGQLPGVSFGDVRRLFAQTGASTNTGVKFLLAGAKTKASAVAVNVTQAAEQARVTADAAVAAPVTITAANKDVTLSVNGNAVTLQLAEGTYATAEALASELQGKVNAAAALGGAKVSVGVDAGRLQITTDAYGASASVTLTGGAGLAALGFTAGQTDAGANVAGSFTVDGVTETAVGTGQFLAGAIGNATTEGLQLQVTLSAAQLNADPAVAEATVSITRGLGSQLDAAVSRFADPVTGRFKSADVGFQSDLDDIKSSIERQNELIEAKREVLLRRFAAMEATISQLQSLGASLGASLAGLGAARAR